MEEIVLEPGQVIKVRCGACSNANTMSNISNSGSTVNLSLASNSNDEGATTGGKRSRKGMKTRKAQAGGKKRGPNGYMKFAAEQRPKILKENPDMRSNVVAVARKIGEAWRALPESERKKY